MRFEMIQSEGMARRGRLHFARGTIETPAFMPVGTYGSVKAMTPEELEALGVEIILGNTFHLMLRPGVEIVAGLGGLHQFMHWQRPILTDSGGFQVFSLAHLRKLSERGVEFRSPIDGSAVMLTPERSIEVQHGLDADIVMIFDECTPYPADFATAESSMELSLRWARRSRTTFDALKQDRVLGQPVVHLPGAHVVGDDAVGGTKRRRSRQLPAGHPDRQPQSDHPPRQPKRLESEQMPSAIHRARMQVCESTTPFATP